jgi:hypothetical protein
MNVADTAFPVMQGRNFDSAERREARRQFAVRLVMFIYILMLIEGPLRKWIAPGLSAPLYFLRDPFVIFLYAYCLHARLLVMQGWARIWLVFAFITALIGAVPYMIDSVTPFAWVFGTRAYWLYMPLAFVVASTFQPADLSRFIRLNLWLAIPYALLVIAQYRSPPFAWINLGISGDETSVVMLDRYLVRPNGLFTYTGQNTTFTALLFALFVFFLFEARRTRLDALLLILSGPAIASLAVLSGARATFFIIGLIVLVTVFGSLLFAKTGRVMRGSLLVIGSVILAGVLFTTVYQDMFIGMQERFERATRSEGSFENRALSGILSFLYPIETAPLEGYGIGRGTPGVVRFLGNPSLPYGEADLHRNVNELGLILGMTFVLLRWAFALFLILVAVRAARIGRPEYFPLAAFAAQGIAQGSITHSTLSGFPYWLGAGFTLVAMPAIRSAQAASAAPTLPLARAPSAAVRTTPLVPGRPLHRP